MKSHSNLSRKWNVRALFAAICASMFVLLHVSLYAGSFSAPNSASWQSQNSWIAATIDGMDEFLMTPLDAPYDTRTLEFCEVQSAPSYLLPLRRVRFVYAEQNSGPDADWNTADDTLGECNLTERSSFTGFPFVDVTFTAEGWTPQDYWQSFEQEGFMRPLAGPDVPSLFFFLVQYSLLAGFVGGVMKRR